MIIKEVMHSNAAKYESKYIKTLEIGENALIKVDIYESKYQKLTADLILNKPPVNAMDFYFMKLLWKTLIHLKSISVSIVIISSFKKTIFSGGGQLQDFVEVSYENAYKISKMSQKVCKYMRVCPTIYIVKIEGWSVGDSTGWAISSDIRIGSESTTFMFPEVTMGWSHAGVASYLTSAIGHRASYYLLTGEKMNAVDAERFGLLDKVVDSKDIESFTESLVIKMLHSRLKALRHVKKILYESRIDVDKGLKFENHYWATSFDKVTDHTITNFLKHEPYTIED